MTLFNSDYILKYYFSSESCIFEVCSEFQTLNSKEVFYEFYTSTTSVGVLKFVDASTKIKDLGNIENSEVGTQFI